MKDSCIGHVGNCGDSDCNGQLVCGCKPRRKHNWQCHTRKPATWKRYLWVLARDWNGSLQIKNGYLNRHLFFRFYILYVALCYKWTWTKVTFEQYILRRH